MENKPLGENKKIQAKSYFFTIVSILIAALILYTAYSFSKLSKEDFEDPTDEISPLISEIIENSDENHQFIPDYIDFNSNNLSDNEETQYGSGDYNYKDEDYLESDQNCLISLNLSTETGSKNVCLIAESKKASQAAKICEHKGMQLLKITTEKVRDEIFAETAKIFGTGGGTALWIDGVWSNVAQTWVSWHDQSLIDSDVDFGVEGFCLNIESPVKYEMTFRSCENKSYFFCESE